MRTIALTALMTLATTPSFAGDGSVRFVRDTTVLVYHVAPDGDSLDGPGVLVQYSVSDLAFLVAEADYLGVMGDDAVFAFDDESGFYLVSVKLGDLESIVGGTNVAIGGAGADTVITRGTDVAFEGTTIDYASDGGVAPGGLGNDTIIARGTDNVTTDAGDVFE